MFLSHLNLIRSCFAQKGDPLSLIPYLSGTVAGLDHTQTSILSLDMIKISVLTH